MVSLRALISRLRAYALDIRYSPIIRRFRPGVLSLIIASMFAASAAFVAITRQSAAPLPTATRSTGTVAGNQGGLAAPGASLPPFPVMATLPPTSAGISPPPPTLPRPANAPRRTPSARSPAGNPLTPGPANPPPLGPEGNGVNVALLEQDPTQAGLPQSFAQASQGDVPPPATGDPGLGDGGGGGNPPAAPNFLPFTPAIGGLGGSGPGVTPPTGGGGGGGGGSIPAVPEPESVTLMLVGLGALAVIGRRRRRVPPAA